MRRAFVLLHRWFGLFTAVFLFIAGLTGAVISWDHELDAWLNPDLFHARSAPGAGAPLPSLALAREVERADPRVRVRYIPLAAEPGHALVFFVEPRIDPATRQPYALGFNQIALDPATGAIQGRRMWGDASLGRENLLPFLYKLHYSLHLPGGGAIESGVLLMGIVGIVWALDCFIALWISFPHRKSWRKSFAFRWRQGGYRLTFDLHRSGGVWLWLLLLTVAVTSVSMNLGNQVVRPIVSLFSPLTPGPFDSRTPSPPEDVVEAAMPRERVIELARQEAARRGWRAPAGAIFYASEYGVYGVGFFEPGNDHGDGGLGNPWLYFEGTDGAPAGAHVPGQGSAGDIFLQAQFPLHSGRILGVPGRALMSLLGLSIAMLSVTGVVIWARKRRARSASARKHALPAEPGLPV
jgi:uncharacterized iron-regulated membrane protein